MHCLSMKMELNILWFVISKLIENNYSFVISKPQKIIYTTNIMLEFQWFTQTTKAYKAAS